MNTSITTAQQGLTQAEIAERLGLSLPTISRRIEAAGLKPIREAIPSKDGIIPAIYDENEAKTLISHEINKQVLAIPTEVRQAAFRNAVDTMIEEGDTDGLFASAAVFVTALQKANYVLQDRIKEKELTIANLRHENTRWKSFLEIYKMYPEHSKLDKNGRPVSDPEFVAYALAHAGREQRQDTNSRFPYFVYDVDDVNAFYGSK